MRKMEILKKFRKKLEKKKRNQRENRRRTRNSIRLTPPRPPFSIFFSKIVNYLKIFHEERLKSMKEYDLEMQ